MPDSVVLLKSDDQVWCTLNGVTYLDGSDVKIWGTEKTAIQWFRRIAKEENSSFEITKLDQSKILVNYEVPPVYVSGKHDWRKANTLMALRDSGGQYNLLYCSYCMKKIKVYLTNRHFPQENEFCEKNLIKVEA